MSDEPGTLFRSRNALTIKFETAVVCLETREVLGVIRWGFRVPPGGGRLEIYEVTVVQEVSKEFNQAIERANRSGQFEKLTLR
jgi:hypothetical protein